MRRWWPTTLYLAVLTVAGVTLHPGPSWPAVAVGVFGAVGAVVVVGRADRQADRDRDFARRHPAGHRR